MHDVSPLHMVIIRSYSILYRPNYNKRNDTPFVDFVNSVSVKIASSVCTVSLYHKKRANTHYKVSSLQNDDTLLNFKLF